MIFWNLFNKSKRYILLLSVIFTIYMCNKSFNIYQLLNDDRTLLNLETIMMIIKYRSII